MQLNITKHKTYDFYKNNCILGYSLCLNYSTAVLYAQLQWYNNNLIDYC